ncbi:uncharacterized protein AMSG_00891 [Thecamonas trahens ATCC 50062]|uniref:Uncharacterized protein n=1 Tax=Thecamonas trahens ATCC 50062 TaxID=461836 RepID=A0A0L0DIA5_THETB|nr:hypothetical protein AMSG_00891 [Thecamonas trahens ATCC 50062]KNC52064.1 hypothetical protein AMSG_00891 [Thecamonas trahens ATCC 50062]|eukprot:XP_013762069.1 hypothetical protein AMSG_00891 [Thecamonas trahens ATCC 50062]
MRSPAADSTETPSAYLPLQGRGSVSPGPGPSGSAGRGAGGGYTETYALAAPDPPLRNLAPLSEPPKRSASPGAWLSRGNNSRGNSAAPSMLPARPHPDTVALQLELENLRDDMRVATSVMTDLRSRLGSMELAARNDAELQSELLSKVSQLERDREVLRSSLQHQMQLDQSEMSKLATAVARVDENSERKRQEDSISMSRVLDEVRTLKSALVQVQMDASSQSNELANVVQRLALDSKDGQMQLLSFEERERQNHSAAAASAASLRDKLSELEAVTSALQIEIQDTRRRAAAQKDALVLAIDEVKGLVNSKESTLQSKIHDAVKHLSAMVENADAARAQDAQVLRAAQESESKMALDREAYNNTTISNRFSQLESALHDEQAARSKLEQELWTHFDTRWRKMEDANHQASLLRANEEKIFRAEFLEGLQTLRASVAAVEEEARAQIEGVEALVRAETKARLQSDALHTSHWENVKALVGSSPK